MCNLVSCVQIFSKQCFSYFSMHIFLLYMKICFWFLNSNGLNVFKDLELYWQDSICFSCYIDNSLHAKSKVYFIIFYKSHFYNCIAQPILLSLTLLSANRMCLQF